MSNDFQILYEGPVYSINASHRARGNWVYKKREIKEYQEVIALTARKELNKAGIQGILFPDKRTELYLDVFYYYIKNKKDRSNILKLVEDALEGVFYVNDSVISDGRTKRIKADWEGLVVRVGELYEK
jgi:Holliday junction resolvase RusA-like endonuclease